MISMNNAFGAIMNNVVVVEACKTWLLVKLRTNTRMKKRIPFSIRLMYARLIFVASCIIA
jgi:hypothetical protein